MNANVMLLWWAEVAGRGLKELIAFTFDRCEISSRGTVADPFQYCSKQSKVGSCSVSGSAGLGPMAPERARLLGRWSTSRTYTEVSDCKNSRARLNELAGGVTAVLFLKMLRIDEPFLDEVGLSGRRLASSLRSREFNEYWDATSLEGGLASGCSGERGVCGMLSGVEGRRSSALGSRKMPFGACVLSRSSVLMKLIAIKSSPVLEGAAKEVQISI